MLPQNEVVHSLRLVCKQWRNEIDKLYDFRVELDDRKAGWERVLDLRVKHCRIVHFIRPPATGPGTRIFKYTNLIRTLIMHSAIHPANFFYVLADCAGSILELKINNIGYHLLGFEFPSKFCNFHFNRLESLDVRLCTLRNQDSTEAFPFSPFLNLGEGKGISRIFNDFVAASFPSLKNLRVEVRCFGFDQTSSAISTVLSFLSKQRQLKSFNFELILGHGLPTSEFRPLSDSDLQTINLQRLRQIANLEGLRLVSSSPIGVNLLIDFLDQQQALRYLEVDLFPAPCSVFREVVLRNVNTLVSVEITDLCIWDEEGNCTPFDVSAFAGCHGLKKLILDRNIVRRRIFDTDELIKLYNLPASLEELALNYFNIRTDEFVQFVNSEAGQHVAALMLTQCGSTGEFGVNGTVLECIVELPNIHFVEISPLNFSDPEERDKLNILLETFGYSADHAYFQYTRITAELPVRIRAFLFADEYDDDEED